MAVYETSYQQMALPGDHDEETPQDTGVVFHVVQEGNKARWNHIDDLDSFFTRVYTYHQKHGFTCMMLQELLELVQFIFVVVFTTFLFQCVNYPVLFKDEPLPNDREDTKVTLNDVVIPAGECVAGFGFTMWICLLVAVVFWILRAIRVVYHVFQYWEIKSFYNTALKIADSDIDNVTWHEVQRRLREVQSEQQMCIHKQELTELDIYHRILRYKNYMVAMVNKSLLPLRINVPFIGEMVFLTRGLKYNLELLLFWGPWAPFENTWHLREDYKKFTKRKELCEYLGTRILWVGLINLILCPLILLWQILYSFFNYAELIKREPGTLGMRKWSMYGRLYLRHFNELDHEINARLNRAYRPASKYMDSFTSPLMTVIAMNLTFVAGAILAVLVILAVYDEDVLTVEHVLTIITVLGAVLAGCRVFIPDENLVWCPERLMTAVLAHVNYLPDHFAGKAHTYDVQKEFSQLFQYRAVHLFEELISPIVTPLILCLKLRHKAMDIVDFYRNFTVEVVGVGDVCSFAQMDVRRHGNPTWQGGGEDTQPPTVIVGPRVVATQTDQFTQAEDGKTELSLVHFTLTNPEWRPPQESEAFMANLRLQAEKDINILKSPLAAPERNPLFQSLHSMSVLGTGYSSLASNILRSPLGAPDQGLGPPPVLPSEEFMMPGPSHQPVLPPVVEETSNVKGGISRTEGPLHVSGRGLFASLTSSGSLTSSIPGMSEASLMVDPLRQPGDDVSLEWTTADMSLSALYLHQLHKKQIRRRVQTDTAARLLWQHPTDDMPEIAESPDEEKTPLLEDPPRKS